MTLVSTHAELEELGGGRFRHTQHMKRIAYYDAGNLKRMAFDLSAMGDAAYPVGAVNGDLYFKLDTAWGRF